MAPDLQWPRRTPAEEVAAWPPRERRCCLRLKALGTVAAVVEAVPGHSQIRITVFLFPRLTWPLRRMHGDGRLLAVLASSRWMITAGPSGVGLSSGCLGLMP